MNYATEIDRAIDSDELARALTVAEQWIAETPADDAGWSKLAHVHVMGDDFGLASSAVREALRIAPDYPPYLFEQGYIEYRLANYAPAASAFGLCAERSELMQDGFYLDAARIAQARCLLLDGRADMAANIIALASPGSATWLDGRFAKEDVANSIQSVR
jgi:tetratricopeptide (TPR) repeat protein